MKWPARQRTGAGDEARICQSRAEGKALAAGFAPPIPAPGVITFSGNTGGSGAGVHSSPHPSPTERPARAFSGGGDFAPGVGALGGRGVGQPGAGQANPVGGPQGDEVVVEVVVRVVQQAGAGVVALAVGGAVAAVAVADEAISAGFFQQHVGKVFRAHGGFLLQQALRADDALHDLAGEAGFVGGVNGGRVVAVKVELAARAKGGADALADFAHAALDEVQRFNGEGAHGALDFAGVGHDVGGFAGVDHGDGDHACIDGFFIAADDGLQALHDLAGHGDGVCGGVGHGGVAALAGDEDAKFVAAGHDGAGGNSQGAFGHAGPVVHAEDGFGREFLKEAVGNHGGRAAAAFFGGLEDEVDGAVEVAVGGQVLGGGQQGGGVAVVAAAVHLAGHAAGVGEGVGLGHGQRVHVGAQGDGAAAAAGVAPEDDADDAGFAHAAQGGDAPFGEFLHDQLGGAVLFVGGFGVGVQITPQGGHGLGLGDDFDDQVHSCGAGGGGERGLGGAAL